MLLIREISLEEAEKVLEFFQANPRRKTCVVGLGKDGFAVQHTRNDIPKLQSIVANKNASMEKTEKTEQKARHKAKYKPPG